MNHPMTRIFVPITMIVLVAIGSASVGLEDAVQANNIAIASTTPGAEEATVVMASQIEPGRSQASYSGIVE